MLNSARMTRPLLGCLLLLAPVLGGCLNLPWNDEEEAREAAEPAASPAPAESPPPPVVPILGKKVLLPSGLMYVDLVLGEGPSPGKRSRVRLHYTQTLVSGAVFDSTKGREPFEFVYGVDRVIPGWEEGLKTMRAGGSRKLIVPPEMAFGKEGRLGVVPPDATIICDVHLVSVESP